MPASPSIDNLSILKGILKFTPEGGSIRDLGEAPEVELTPAIEKLDYLSSRSGVRTKTKSVVLEKTMQIRAVLSELNAENLGLLLMAEASTNTAGNMELNIFENSEIKGQIDFEGTNDVGNQINMTLLSVSFGPSGSLNLISDEWGQIEITGEVLTVNGVFGTVEVVDEA